MRRRHAEAVAELNPQLAREIRRATFEALLRLQSQVVIVGRTTAIEKVGAFLLDIPRAGSPPRAIASYCPFRATIWRTISGYRSRRSAGR